jgi:prepilin-type N-terminal cleavage/methylation domain-containing protein
MNRLINLLKCKFRAMHGFSLVEVLVAVSILSLIGTGLFSALGGASRVLLHADIRESARDLAEAQMEYIQNLEYKTADPSGVLVFYDKVPNLSTNYPGFDVETQASRVDKGSGITDDTGIQEITVVVKKDNSPIFTLKGMKVNRETP